MRILINITILIVVALALIAVFNYGLKKQERAECVRWQAEADEARKSLILVFHPFNWMIDQCEFLGLPLNWQK